MKEDLQLFIKERLQQLRIDKNVSARDMSLSIGQGSNYINQIENGTNLPSLEGLQYICDYFDITLSDFFNSEIDDPALSREIVKGIHSLNKESAESIIKIIELLSHKK